VIQFMAVSATMRTDRKIDDVVFSSRPCSTTATALVGVAAAPAASKLSAAEAAVDFRVERTTAPPG
jgi:hypothetical protein